ncbi:hypothetical protein AKJ64_04685 [candidate division MSBL1 archaeon SCGC-AAA259E17]|uniref:Polymerase nucleotidyl transferase domain-containing protein n=1 Tax=candidate division MSBL1 archaeon SCGC-AAA259E17 TaxID=1698263 RepID=A0A133UBD8_9EURY|nr:hypothetical protein AKJ64_04685 [candidate division MSBL1 archaeon SCGC-AAA259E17]
MSGTLAERLDSLVEEGVYLNRSEAIRSAVRDKVESLSQKGLMSVARIVASLIRERWDDDVSMIILYGSVARGEIREESDIDLLIVVGGENSREWRRKFNKLIYPMIPELGRQISLIVNTEEELRELREVGDPFILEVLEDGVEL